MKVLPVRQVAMIRPEKLEDKSKGGVWLPDIARERLQVAVDRGEIVAIGEGFFQGLAGPVPKVGDKVIFDRYAGSLITIEDQETKARENYRLVNDEKIVAIMQEG